MSHSIFSLRSERLYLALLAFAIGVVLWWPTAWWLAGATVKHAHVGLESIASQGDAVAAGTALPSWARGVCPAIAMALGGAWALAVLACRGLGTRVATALMPIASAVVMVALLSTDVWRLGLYLLD